MEALERRGKLVAILAIVFIVFWSQCTGVEGHRNSTKMSYVCPPQFIRLGHSCYYFSDTTATWQDALFACKDRDSNLTVPARWEDRNLRNFLNKPELEKTSRWIGGIYDYGDRSWKWGGELREMRYQSFSKMKKMTPDDLQWHCIAMMPELLYRWSPRSCIEPRKYICQTKLKKEQKSKVKDYRRRWQDMGQINEITAPSMSSENNDPALNDVTANPGFNLKSYKMKPSPLRRQVRPAKNNQRSNYIGNELHPYELRKRSRAPKKRTIVFPGYTWNRHNPVSSFNYNAKLLQSGKTGLTSQQVKTLLVRLAHMRDRQLTGQLKRKHSGDSITHGKINKTPKQRKMVQLQGRSYTVDRNISALHPKMIVEELNLLPSPSVRYQRNVLHPVQNRAAG